MANTVKQLAQAALTTSNAILYTVPASTKTIVKEIIFCNTSSSTTTVDVYFVPSAGSAGVSNTFVSQMSLRSYETITAELTTILDTDTTIVAKAGTGAVVGVTISGIEIA